MSFLQITGTELALCAVIACIQGFILILVARLWLKLQSSWFGGGIISATLGNVCFMLVYRLMKPYLAGQSGVGQFGIYSLIVVVGIGLSCLILSQIWRITYWQAVKSNVPFIALAIFSLTNFLLRQLGYIGQ